jgi:hypothetical protein
MKSFNKSILLALLTILSITGSYASKGLETMFLEHKVVTNNQGLKIHFGNTLIKINRF